MASPPETLSPRARRREAEYFPSLPSHPDFIGPTAYAEHIASSQGTVPEPAAPVTHEDAVAPSTEVPSLVYERVSTNASAESIASCVTQEDEELYLPLLQYEINGAYIELYANTHDPASDLEGSFRYTIPTIILGYLRRKYDAERAASGIIQRVIEGAMSWRKGASKHARCDDADEEVDHAKDRPGSARTATASPEGNHPHWSSKDPLGALEYMFDLIVKIAIHFPWAAAKGEAGHQMLVELVYSVKEILEKICSDDEKAKDKQAGVKVEWKDEIRDAFSRTLVTVLNRHWVVRMPAESVVPGHEETVNFASFLSFLVARFPCPRSTAYSKMFLPSGQFVGFTEAKEVPLNERDFAPLDLLYTLMKHDLESFYCAKLLKAQSSKENFKLAMTCAMYLMITGHRLWEYYILNGRESDWAEKGPGAEVIPTTTTDRQAAREMGKAHWHYWMSAMYSISQDEDADCLVRGAAVQAVSKMGRLVTKLMQHQELEGMEEEEEGEAGADIEAALATQLQTHN